MSETTWGDGSPKLDGDYMEPTHMPSGPIKPGEVAEALHLRGSENLINADDPGLQWTLGTGQVMITTSALPQTELAGRIVNHHMPAALDHFLRRNEEYGDDDDFNLGSRGQYVDISRKVQKLKRRMWEGRPVKDGEESTRTVVMELIGHLLMTMDYLEEEDGVPEQGEG